MLAKFTVSGYPNGKGHQLGHKHTAERNEGTFWDANGALTIFPRGNANARDSELQGEGPCLG